MTAPTTDRRHWRQAAACVGTDPEVFYATERGGPAHWRDAAAICDTCPAWVVAECDAWMDGDRYAYRAGHAPRQSRRQWRHTTHRAWTPEDDALLSSGLTDAQIAERLGRTVDAVAIRRRRLAIPSAVDPRTTWTPDEDAHIRAGLDTATIARLTGRTIRAVRARRARLTPPEETR